MLVKESLQKHNDILKYYVLETRSAGKTSFIDLGENNNNKKNQKNAQRVLVWK